MREVEVSRLTDVIEKLCIEANEHLPEDVKCAIKTCRASKTLCGLRQRVRPKVQPGEILSRLCRQSSQAAENRK